MLSILTTRRFKEWWWQAQQWFRNQLETVSVYLTPVEDKLDEVKEAVDNIDTSDLAKEATLGDVASVLDYIEGGGLPSITAIAKQGSNANADISTIQEKIGTPASGQSSTLFGAIANINIDTSNLAKQGTNSSATNTAIKSAVDALSPVADAAEAYNTGKVQLATNITAKGVQASSSETLPQLASKVAQIAQQPIIWDESEVGDQYAAQLFGDADTTTSPLWNLYEVLKNCKNTFLNAAYEHEGNIYNYNALIICEYYKGYDSLELKGADAYFTCDGDFYNYGNPTHVWHDSENGKANRWVCFLYMQEGSSFEIRNTAISPRSIYIGGHIGTIEYFVTGRLTDVVGAVEATDYVDNLLFKGYAQAFGFNCVLRGVKNLNYSGETATSFNSTSAGTLVIKTLDNYTVGSNNQIFLISSASFIYVYGAKNISCSNSYFFATTAAIGINCPDVETHTNSNAAIFRVQSSSNLLYINLESLKSMNAAVNIAYPYGGGSFANLIDLKVGAMESSLTFNNWNPTNVLADATKKAQLIDNIKNNILARVSDRTGLSQLTFKVSTNMFNSISGENITWQGQTMTLADAFLTKNWLLAGA